MKRNASVSKLLFTLALISLTAYFGALPPVGAEDKVLAKIGNETITESDLTTLTEAAPDAIKQSATSPTARRKWLDHLIDIYALAAAAEAKGVSNTPEFQRLLKFAKKDILARTYFDKQFKALPKPTEAEAKAYYDKNVARFRTPESVHLRHILVKTEKEAKDALAKLKKGANFSELASKISTCPSKANGGDLDWMPKGKLVKEIEDVAFSMKKNEVTGPVKTKFGYHVVNLVDKRPEKVSPFNEVKPWLIQQLEFKKRQEYYGKLAKDLRDKLKVQILVPDKPIPAGPAAPSSSSTKPAAPPAPGQKKQ